jgi:dTDP-N-acetylfucosamine:lipid II N-acetylfucosaminyltransferase
MKILHISSDEKFINSIYFQFNEVFKDQNRFLIILDKNVKCIKFVSLNDDIETIIKNKKNLDICVNETKNHDITIFHGLNYFQSQIILKAGNKNNFIWFFWGGELYDNAEALGKSVIGKETLKIFHKKSYIENFKFIIRPLYYFLKYQTSIPERSIINAGKKIKYFGVIHKEELEYFKNLGYLSTDASHIFMTYYPLEYIFKGIENTKVNGRNILLGNSSSSSNNHIEAFNILKEFNLGDRKIIVPLSYGNKKYGISISEIGQSIFGENLHPLFDFMTLDQYNILLSSCNVVIMSHYRQQAIGNIVAMLWMGAKVYLDERNTFFHYLKRIGIEIFSINNDLRLDNSLALEGLPGDKININRQILHQEIGFINIKKQLKQSLNSIVSEH